MKNILTALLLVGFLAGTAQKLPFDSATQKAAYTGEVEVRGATASQLFEKAKNFAITGIKQERGKNVLPDENALSVKVRSMFQYYLHRVGVAEDDIQVGFQLTVVCQDGVYKYTYTDLFMGDYPDRWKGPVPGGDFDTDDRGKVPKKEWESIKSWVDKDIKKSIDQLKQAMQQ
ncbi:MAG TPA: DUF4468 domain-containing protein [Puia sp.]|nr:DUF4468 domain-containing protein [Puia sp.]